ncbi:hypothetical protein [Streptomyces ziwulingensis]|uniref:Uncharacterized protein n=1 Tax=Streptomyces ziwulingensis TaxID=1045501 RepID=A0ABP9D5V3_9ACTN
MSAPAPSPADAYPITGVRFVNGRTRHRIRRPVDQRWWDLLEAACGKTGRLASGYTLGAVTECRGCEAAVGAADQQAA